MGIFKQLVRFNTDTLSVFDQSNTSSEGVLLMSKRVSVSVALGSLEEPDDTSRLLSSAQLNSLVTGTGNFYFLIQVAKRGTGLGANDGARIYVQNATGTTFTNTNTAYHTLVNVGDMLVIPWQMDKTDADIEDAPTIAASLTTTAGAGKTLDLNIAVIFTA